MGRSTESTPAGGKAASLGGADIAVGLDIGTGSVKVATRRHRFKFPSVVARGRAISVDGSEPESVFVGEQAMRQEHVRSMLLKTPVYRGVPTAMDDYIELVRHALDLVIRADRNTVWHGPSGYSEMAIVAGIPYNSRDRVEAIKKAVQAEFAPHRFGVMFQARATLENEGMRDGIVCHIGHGTTEMMAVIGGNTAYGETVPHGVGDVVMAVTGSRTGYTDHSVFASGSQLLAENRRILAGHIADSLEKIVIDYPGLDVVFAGGGALVPKLVGEIRVRTSGTVRTADEPVFSNALGMLKKATGLC